MSAFTDCITADAAATAAACDARDEFILAFARADGAPFHFAPASDLVELCTNAGWRLRVLYGPPSATLWLCAAPAAHAAQLVARAAPLLHGSVRCVFAVPDDLCVRRSLGAGTVGSACCGFAGSSAAGGLAASDRSALPRSVVDGTSALHVTVLHDAENLQLSLSDEGKGRGELLYTALMAELRATLGAPLIELDWQVVINPKWMKTTFRPCKSLLDDLRELGVTHVTPRLRKNAVDSQIQLMMSRYARLVRDLRAEARARRVLVIASNDCDFTAALADLRSSGVRVMLLHSGHARDTLRSQADYESAAWRALLRAAFVGAAKAAPASASKPAATKASSHSAPEGSTDADSDTASVVSSRLLVMPRHVDIALAVREDDVLRTLAGKAKISIDSAVAADSDNDRSVLVTAASAASVKDVREALSKHVHVKSVESTTNRAKWEAHRDRVCFEVRVEADAERVRALVDETRSAAVRVLPDSLFHQVRVVQDAGGDKEAFDAIWERLQTYKTVVHTVEPRPDVSAVVREEFVRRWPSILAQICDVQSVFSSDLLMTELQTDGSLTVSGPAKLVQSFSDRVRAAVTNLSHELEYDKSADRGHCDDEVIESSDGSDKSTSKDEDKSSESDEESDDEHLSAGDNTSGDHVDCKAATLDDMAALDDDDDSSLSSSTFEWSHFDDDVEEVQSRADAEVASTEFVSREAERFLGRGVQDEHDYLYDQWIRRERKSHFA